MFLQLRQNDYYLSCTLRAAHYLSIGVFLQRRQNDYYAISCTLRVATDLSTHILCVFLRRRHTTIKFEVAQLRKGRNASQKNEISDSLEQLTVNVTWKTNYSNNILHSKRRDMLESYKKVFNYNGV